MLKILLKYFLVWMLFCIFVVGTVAYTTWTGFQDACRFFGV